MHLHATGRLQIKPRPTLKDGWGLNRETWVEDSLDAGNYVMKNIMMEKCRESSSMPECGMGMKHMRSDNGGTDRKDVCRLDGGRP